MRYMGKHDISLDAESYVMLLPDTEHFTVKARHLLQKNVMEIASKHTITAPRGTPLTEVCRLFAEHRLNKLPVTEGGVLVGTVSRGDIMRMLMGRLPLSEGGPRPDDAQ